jgi:hypothetical protein
VPPQTSASRIREVKKASTNRRPPTGAVLHVIYLCN